MAAYAGPVCLCEEDAAQVRVEGRGPSYSLTRWDATFSVIEPWDRSRGGWKT